MVIKCALSFTPENMGFYADQSWKVPPLPEYITKIGPYIIDQQDADNQIIIIYEFNELKFVEAWKCITEQLDTFLIIPGFTLSVNILDKGREVKGYRISLNQSGADLDSMRASVGMTISKKSHSPQQRAHISP